MRCVWILGPKWTTYVAEASLGRGYNVQTIIITTIITRFRKPEPKDRCIKLNIYKIYKINKIYVIRGERRTKYII